MLIIRGEFPWLWFQRGSTSVLIKCLPTTQIKCWLRSQCEAWTSVVCAPATRLALCRSDARSTAISPQSSLNGGEESQGSPQLRGIKGCRSLFSGRLTLSPYLNHEQHKYYCVRESLKRLHSLSLRAGGRRELVVCEATDGLKLLCEFWVRLYICISVMPCAFLSSGTQPEAVG